MFSKEIIFINNLFENIYSSNNDIPPHSYQISTKKPIESKLIAYADLGDYLPFLILSGASRKYIQNQIELTKISFQKEPLIGSSVPHYMRRFSENEYIKKFLLNIGNEVSLAFSYSDFLFGLILIHRIDKSFNTLDFALDTTKYLEKSFLGENGWLYYAKNISSGSCHKIIDSNNDFFSELYCELFDLTKDQKYVDNAKVMITASLDSYMFKKYGVVSAITQVDGFLSRFIYKKLMRKFILAKNNSSFAESLLAIYKSTNDKNYLDYYYKWVYSVVKLKTLHQSTPFSWDYNSNKITTNLKNYALIDCLLNGYLVTNDDYLLEQAELVIMETLKWQDQETKLIKENNNSDISFFDSNTDFSVSLVKFAHLSKKEFYFDTAKIIANAQIKYHKTSLGYSTYYFFSKRKCSDYVSTRYTSLFLKLLLVIQAYSCDKLEKDSILWSALRDR